MPPTRQSRPRRREYSPERLSGAKLCGRMIHTRWTDGKWYDAVVVRYYHEEREHKLIYLADDAVEVTALDKRQWNLVKRRTPKKGEVILTGSVIEFVYPFDNQFYRAMIYGHDVLGEKLKVVYMDDHSMDELSGKGWTFISKSPCVLPSEDGDRDADTDEEDAEEEGEPNGGNRLAEEDDDGNQDANAAPNDDDQDDDYVEEETIDTGSEKHPKPAAPARRGRKRAKPEPEPDLDEDDGEPEDGRRRSRRSTKRTRTPGRSR